MLGNLLGRVRAQRYRPANGAEAAVVVVAAKDEKLGPGEEFGAVLLEDVEGGSARVRGFSDSRIFGFSDSNAYEPVRRLVHCAGLCRGS
ncbi:hypothetical protein [Streptomyces sp. WM6372]|uniref:hypothetical protein n=1 Tax=Streptomyces sp. WM6372 TaxID=1415555 RepID=UPI00131D0598|nr:hypothetical protein [Streptomyces sp. WM6372]